MKIKSKSANQIKHFKRKVENRLGIVINDNDIRLLVDDINNQRYTEAVRQSCRVSVYTMNIRDIKCKIVFDKNRKTPVTVITNDMSVSKHRYELDYI